MQTNHIRRGDVLIGSISFESSFSALGAEVVATTKFAPPDGEGPTDQFESYDAALRFLHYCYEAHCEAGGVTPEPRAPMADAEDDPHF